MQEIKTDLFPGNLYAAKNKAQQSNDEKNVTGESVEPLPESERPRKDGPGGE